MKLKRLIDDSSATTSFNINQQNGILVFNHSSGKECIYIEYGGTSQLSNLNQFNEVCDIRFFGSEELYHEIIDEFSDWPEFLKKIYVTDERRAIYYAHEDKVRIEKVLDSLEVETSNERKKVLVIDDSGTIQKLLTKIIDRSEKLEVLGTADCPSQARELIERERPDLITLDIHMPEMNGVEFLKTYLEAKNIPTIMISSVSLNEGPLVMEALSHGAHSYIQKPSIDKLDELAPAILEELESIASINTSKISSFSSGKNLLSFESTKGLLAIGCSTGGPCALQTILTDLPADIPPTVIVQHIPEVFSKALADRLNTLCPFHVKEAEDGDFLKENTVYIAPGGKQFKLLKRGKEIRVSINDDPPMGRFKPSVDYLFNSIPKLETENLVGVILTGMGKDGAQGLLELKNCGAKTIAQDEESSIVFGMPKEAIRLGAAEKIISLNEIAKEIVIQFNRNNNKHKAA